MFGTVYLIHFHAGIPNRTSCNGRAIEALHYLGWADDLDARLDRHRHGGGAKIMAEVQRRGIDWTLARVWMDRDRHFERALKNRRNAPRLCPLCVGDKAIALKKCTAEELLVVVRALATHANPQPAIMSAA